MGTEEGTSQTVSLEDITKEEFQAYERVRRSGRINMITEADRGARLAKISAGTYLGIIVHYRTLAAQWPGVRDLS